jgi:hypothetical protein
LKITIKLEPSELCTLLSTQRENNVEKLSEEIRKKLLDLPITEEPEEKEGESENGTSSNR